jgi:hypothetical protein
MVRSLAGHELTTTAQDIIHGGTLTAKDWNLLHEAFYPTGIQILSSEGEIPLLGGSKLKLYSSGIGDFQELLLKDLRGH